MIFTPEAIKPFIKEHKDLKNITLIKAIPSYVRTFDDLDDSIVLSLIYDNTNREPYYFIYGDFMVIFSEMVYNDSCREDLNIFDYKYDNLEDALKSFCKKLNAIQTLVGYEYSLKSDIKEN